MNARLLVSLAALAAWSLPASAAIVIEEAQVAGGELRIFGQVTPPTRSVAVQVAPASTVLVEPDWNGRFAWIGAQIPAGCRITVTAGGERLDTAVAFCGPGAQPVFPVQAGTTDYGAGGLARGEVAPGAGVERSVERTTERRVRPLIISPNDPDYAHTEPPHDGRPYEQGTHSGEVIYRAPPYGFYGNIRSKENP